MAEQDKKNIRIQSRADTAEYWRDNNPVLLDREIGYEIDTGNYKIGNGIQSWNELPYFSIGEITPEGDVLFDNSVILPSDKANINVGWKNNTSLYYYKVLDKQCNAIDGTTTFILNDYIDVDNKPILFITVNDKMFEARVLTDGSNPYVTKYEILSENSIICYFYDLDLDSALNTDIKIFTYLKTLKDFNSSRNSGVFGVANSVANSFSFAFGKSNKNIGMSSFTIGESNIASGPVSYATGNSTVASGFCSHTEGALTVAQGENSHAEGYNTIATEDYQHVQGKYNFLDDNNKSGNYAHIVGNGTDNTKRSNAYTLDWDGNAWFAGDITIGVEHNKLATEDYVNNSIVNNAIPSGIITMWSGSNIPNGWVLCNGENNTPDLRDKFIVGAGQEYSIGDTGGEKEIVLTIEQLPSHAHTVDYSGMFRNNSDVSTAKRGLGDEYDDKTYKSSYVGDNQAHENRPPYYALAYIMKI